MLGDKRANLILLLILVSLLVYIPKINVTKAESKSIVVPDDFQTIQEAINNANEGDTVFVKSGTYDNQTLAINKKLSLVGEDPTTTILAGWEGRPPINSATIHLNANDVTISGFTFKVPGHWGIWGSGNRTKISGNILTHPKPINLFGSYNNITGNNITEFAFSEAIHLTGSFNTILKNNIEGGHNGIITEGSFNTISENDIKSTFYQINVDGNSNIIFKNNMRKEGAYAAIWFLALNSGSQNIVNWNYWGDYDGIDNDSDGIGDTPYIINAENQDPYPLIAPITVFDAGLWEWTQYYVDVISNSSVSDFSFNPEEGDLIRFIVNGENGTAGFCRVEIPKDLLYTEGNWIVLVDGNVITPTVNEDQNSSYLYFTYQQSSTLTKTVEIIGTVAIPEFPSWTILPLFATATLIVILVRKRLMRTRTSIS